MEFHFSKDDIEIVQKALQIATDLNRSDKNIKNPNVRSQAFIAICSEYLKRKHVYIAYTRRAS